MKIYNTRNKSDFENSINQIANKLEIEIDYNSISGNCYRVKLVKKKENKNYQRKGFYNNKNGTPRKVNAICWHGYRDFLTELYKIYSDLRVFTAQITYNNKEDFDHPKIIQPKKEEAFVFLTNRELMKLNENELSNYYNKFYEYYLKNPERASLQMDILEESDYLSDSSDSDSEYSSDDDYYSE